MYGLPVNDDVLFYLLDSYTTDGIVFANSYEFLQFFVLYEEEIIHKCFIEWSHIHK